MVGSSELSRTEGAIAAPRRAHSSSSDEHRRRLEGLFTSQLDFVSSTLRRYGVPPADLDDATQQVFLVLGRRLEVVRPGAERGFLFRTAVHVAAHARRALARKREQLGEIPETAFEQAGADEVLHTRRAREHIAHVLAKMSSGVRAVVVLHELEQKTMLEISTALGVPSGTVASRLRRGRALLHREIRRLERAGMTP